MLFMLLSLEVMMNAAALAFVVAGSRWGQPDGQIMFILILSLAAAEASIGLAILLQFYRRIIPWILMRQARCADEPPLFDVSSFPWWGSCCCRPSAIACLKTWRP
jgi:hypothetical protein